MAFNGGVQPNTIFQKSKPSLRTRRKYIWAYIFLLPQAIMFFIFSLYPIVMSYIYSFFHWDGLGPLDNFVGLDNYVKLLQDSYFWKAFEHTVVYVAGTTILGVGFALVLAIILNDATIKGKGVYRTVYFVPVVTSTAIIGIIMANIFGIDGFINKFLQWLHLINSPIPFMTNGVLAMIILIVVGTWKGLGINLIYWLASLQGIPVEIYESAQIDGAGFWQTLRHITLPLLKPMMAVIVLLSIVGGMQVFDLVKTLTNGGPYFKTETLDLFIYNYAFSGEHSSGTSLMGYASAAGVLLGIFSFFVSLVFGGVGLTAGLKKKKKEGKHNVLK